MKIKRITALLLSLIMTLSLVCVPANAATVDELKSDIVLEEGAVGGKSGIYVNWKVTTGAGGILTANIALAYDKTVFDLVDETGAVLAFPNTDPPTLNDAQLITSDFELFNDFYAKNGTGTTAIIAFVRSAFFNAKVYTTATTIGQCFLAYKDGKSISDVTEDALRYATPAEAEAIGQSSVVGMGDENFVEFKYGTSNSTDTAEWENNLTFAESFDFAKPALTGTPTISGTVKVGETLTAGVAQLSDTTNITYQWCAGGADITGATSATYVLTANEAGKTITVKVTATNASEYAGTVTSAATAIVEKADGPVAPTGLVGVAPTTDGGSDGKITGTATTMEYSTDSSFANPVGTVCPDTETTGLTAGIYYVRVKETTTHKAGANATVIVPAYVAAPTYAVTVTNGTATPSGAQAEGTSVTITANAPETGKQFKEWTGADSLTFTSGSKTTATATFTMPAEAVNVTATYEDIPVNTYAVTVTGGTATPSGAQAEGTSVTITANAPETGKQFKEWTGADSLTFTSGSKTTATATFTMPAEAVNVTATYEDIPVNTYAVTVTGGTATPSGAQAEGTSVTITANAPETGKQFKEWTGADSLTFTSGSKTTATATFTMPAEAVNVTATYEDIPVTTYTITYNANGGYVTPANAVTGADGKLTSLPTPTRSGSYSFNGWYTAASGGTKVTTSTVFNANTTIYAQWTYTGGGGGGGGYVSTYAITVEDAKNGDVTVSHKSTYKGATVTVTVAPDKGYTLETLIVTDKNGKEIELANKGDGKYTFKMPGSKVTVKATFMDDNTMLNFFVDVPANAYYYDAVLWAVKEGITNGTSATTFSPDNPCTRAQMATFLWRAAGSPEPVSKTCIFVDVPADAYYAKAVQWAYEQKITVGTSATTFSPDKTCTRAQMATFLCRVAEGKPVSDTVIFADVKADKYYAKSVQWAYEQKITVGTSATTFSPDDPCTRAQMVTFLYRYFVK